MNNPFIYESAPEYCHPFFDLVETDQLLEELEKSKIHTLQLIDNLTPENENFAYAPDKWTVKEVIRHIIDCERIYTYRALRFSRFDATDLAGFDENQYINQLKAVDYQLSDLREEYLSIRKATLLLYKYMTPEMLDFKDLANTATFTARSLGFMAVGHNLHHLKVIYKNYLTI